jgi:hypothetical protein
MKQNIDAHDVKHHANKMEREIKVRLQAFLTSTLGGDEGTTPRSRRFIPGTHWVRAWVGTRAGLLRAEKEKNPDLYQELNAGRPSIY